MKEFNMKKVIKELAEDYKVFFSEAHFQFQLAWKIKEIYPNANIALETKPFIENSNNRLDIDLELNGEHIAIELKYFHGAYHIKANDLYKGIQKIEDDRLYYLNKQNDTWRSYDFIKDISRLEELCEEDKYQKGYALVICSEKTYWKSHKNDKQYNYSQFRLSDKRVIEAGNTLSWKEQTKANQGKRNPSLKLKNEYKFIWEDYSKFSGIRNNKAKDISLKYLMVEVSK
jgi:hypothetical protein